MPKALLRFFLVAIGIYIPLVLLWPFLRTPYTAFYRALGNTVFSSVGKNISVTFRPLSKSDQISDTEMVLRNRQAPGAYGTKPASSRYDGYIPTCLVVSLILATPVSIRRRSSALLWALLLIYMFVVIRRWIVILHAMSQGDSISAFNLHPMIKTILEILVQHVLGSIIASSYIVPLFVWILTMFRSQDWERLRTLAHAPRSKFSITEPTDPRRTYSLASPSRCGISARM